MATATRSPVHDRVNQLTEEIKIRSRSVYAAVDEIGQVMVGQHQLIQRMFVGLLGNGHLLIEGVPGLAKTTAVACLAKGIDTGFQRLQFTPDLLPADLIGTLVYRPQDQKFVVQKGPIFSNLILADEINRAPAKVQSALLEAMQERQVTIGSKTFPLDDPFLVMATQKPGRARRNLSAARSPDGSLHAESRGGLSEPRRRTADSRSHVEDAIRSPTSSP